MIRAIYHGSSRIVRAPRFGAGNPYNDFGLGFYCALGSDLAAEWAVELGRNGFISKYSINDTGLRIIDLTSPQYSILHWLSVLSNYREFDTSSSIYYQCKEYIRSTFQVDTQSCDCMIGLRADNSNFALAQEFMNGEISYGQLREALDAGNTGRQFVLKSNRAFDRVVFDGHEMALSRSHYPVKIERELAAMRKSEILRGPESCYSSTENRQSDEIFVTDILRRGIRPFDPALR